MSLVLLLASLPTVFWSGGLEGAPALRRAGIERLAVPPAEVEAWRKAGFSAVALTPAAFAAREKLLRPGLLVRPDLASATRSPWIFANGWRFLRRPTGQYAYDLPAGAAALAAAEAAAYGADAVLKVDSADLESLGAMLAFVAGLPAADLPPVADLALLDDGSPVTGEVMNMLARRNLLFRAVRTPSPDIRVNVEIGAPDYPKKEAADPSAFALKLRRQVGDEHRSFRIFGSEVVIGRLTGDGRRLRLHLLNYGGRDVEGLRVRVRGIYPTADARVAGLGRVPVEEPVVGEDATEFSIARMGAYAVVDLPPLE
jgi:hypothetical protein